MGGESLSNGKSDMEVDNQKKLRAGTHALEVRRDGMEIIAPFTDGIMSDWDAVEALIDHAIECVVALHCRGDKNGCDMEDGKMEILASSLGFQLKISSLSMRSCLNSLQYFNAEIKCD